MPPSINSNRQLPKSSSSISLNESPNEEINYDSDISEDDHAIAEGDDDEYDYDEENDDGDDEEEEEEEPDEGFAVEVNTLTGSTFNIMIHPSDTVEVLKTRIAFQEGISPADQNILLDSTTGCSNNATVQELNIDRNSKLTLVTNVASGVPFKSTTLSSTATEGFPDCLGGQFINGGGGRGDDHLSSSSPPYKLAPTIKRNYHYNNSCSSGNNGNNNHCSNNQQKHSSSSSSSSLRLPKILTTSSYLDKNGNNNNMMNNGIGNGSAMHRNGHAEIHQQHRQRLDEREWMKSLFNKVVNQNEEEEEDIASEERNSREDGDDDNNFRNSSGAAKIIIDIDSTNGANSDDIRSATTTAVHPPQGARVSTRYIGTKYAPEEDGSILVVQGDDGVILIIQKNTGQLLEETFIRDSNNNSKCNRYNNNHKSNYRFGEAGDNGRGGELINGRIGRLGRYTTTKSNDTTETSVDSSMTVSSSYRKSRYQEESKAVHDKIKENAVTLEKMRQVRSLMAQQKRERSRNRIGENEEDAKEKLSEAADVGLGAVKTFEFPRIGGNKPLGVKTGGGGVGGAAVGYRSNAAGITVGGTKKSAVGGRGKTLRSINSSKMSLNRLIAELYLQTKRKDRHEFQPGQPPYTEQQLVRYVQLKTAILVDEQKKNKTEPCSKCQLDEDWTFDETATYLVPTVVMNRYKRLANGRNSKSLDKGDNYDEDNEMIKTTGPRRKSMIPVVMSSSSTKPINRTGYKNQQSTVQGGGTESGCNSGGGGGGGGSYIPKLILVNREREAEVGANRNNPSSVATTASTVSRRSSSSMTTKLMNNGAYRFSSSSSTNGSSGTNKNIINVNNDRKPFYADEWHDENDDNECICGDTRIIIKNDISRALGNENRNGSGGGGRPTFKVNPKLYYTTTVNGYGRPSSRPGSSKANAAKKGTIRCQTCKKKVGISCRYQCRCGLTLCSVHRYPEAHECTIDYKTEGRNKLRENNPVIVAPKIQEI